MGRVLLFLLVPGVLLLSAPLLHLDERLPALVQWLRSFGPWGPVIYVLVYAAGTVLALPISILAACAGLLFPAWPAFFTLVTGAVLGATLAFFLARTVARRQAQSWLEGSPRLAQLDAALQRRGPIVVVLARMTPGLPFGMVNYAFGLTGVSAGSYVLGTTVGVMPGSALNVVGAAALAEMVRNGTASPALVGLGLGMIVVAVIVGRYAYRVLQ